LLSRGGYPKLEQKMISEKMKACCASDYDGRADTLDEPPSPPSKHEKWK